MFLDFFYTLRSFKVPVSTRELLDLIDVIESMSANAEQIDSNRFYQIGKSVLVKDIKFYDAYDQAFSTSFSNVISESEFKDQLKNWLEDAIKSQLSAERKAQAMNLPNEDLIKELQKRLDEQKERHDGGNKWIGTGGTSAFGHSGFNPAGVRVGGQSKNKSAIAVAGERKYQEYRTDSTLDIRQIKVALKKLRVLKQSGRAQFDLKKTIGKTVEQGGEIDIQFSKSRKNNLKVALLMDIGGSMTVHSKRVSQLFSAAHQVNHFKEFNHFYFHNIFYDDLYTSSDLSFNHEIEFKKFFANISADTKIIIIGDAYMAPYELFNMSARARDFYTTFNRNSTKSDKTGLDRVVEISKKYPNIIWLNPEGKSLWNAPTINAVKSHIPMFELTLDGLERGIKSLLDV